MAEKDIKKSLSLKSRKGSGSKQSKPSIGSKNVTIQVKRKKIIVPSEPEKKDSSLVADDSSTPLKENTETTSNDIKKADIKKESINVKAKNNLAPAKKKNTAGKNDKVEDFKNKELHLKEPKPKKKYNKQEKSSESEILQTHQFEKPTEPIKKEIEIPDAITVSELAQKISVKSSELIKVMMNMGVMATINQSLDQDTAILIIEELGHTATTANESEEEEMTLDLEEHKNEDL